MALYRELEPSALVDLTRGFAAPRLPTAPLAPAAPTGKDEA